ncbi:DUF5522 domain-containing protein [Larkinella soli]|uniref:DUF5522 domain-containing protein n=1 Tax=Larkinella soli TaxID=1770527 RepID=UPI0013E39A55|nr:DUF5522 domain-containing protein [Larkinella soli]
MRRPRPEKPRTPGLEEEDYYYTEEGFLVFTEKYHLKRGYCCRNGCRHCPYGFKREKI